MLEKHPMVKEAERMLPLKIELGAFLTKQLGIQEKCLCA